MWGGDALVLGDAGGAGVAAEGGGEDRRGEAAALDADEEGALGADREPRGDVGLEEGGEGGVDGEDALAAALRVADSQQHRVEVDVVDVEAEQLGAAEAAEREQREQEPVALDAA